MNRNVINRVIAESVLRATRELATRYPKMPPHDVAAEVIAALHRYTGRYYDRILRDYHRIARGSW